MTGLTEQHINELRRRMEQYRTTIRVGTEALRPLRRLLGTEEETGGAVLGMPVEVSEHLPSTAIVVVSSTDVVYFDLATGAGWRFEQQAEAVAAVDRGGQVVEIAYGLEGDGDD